MFGALQMVLLKRKLRSTLSEDTFQNRGWTAWLASRSRRADLLDAPEPGWLVHVAYWFGAHPRVLMSAALGSLEFAASMVTKPEWDRLWESTRPYHRSLDKASLTVLVGAATSSIVAAAGPAGARLLQLPLVESIAVEQHARARAPLAASHQVNAALGLLAVAAIQTEYEMRDSCRSTIAAALALATRAEPGHVPTMLEHLRTACTNPDPPS